MKLDFNDTGFTLEHSMDLKPKYLNFISMKLVLEPNTPWNMTWSFELSNQFQ